MSIAIVGSGPAGCYTADLLARALPGEPIVIYEREAEPFGLVRYGVAPDHAGTKAVAQLFARNFKRHGIALRCGVEVGRDISIEQLESEHSLVVIATGAGTGRLPDFDGADVLPMVSGLQLAGLFNGKNRSLLSRLPRRAGSIVIFGNGNVSLDAARLLAKPAEQLAAAGVPQEVIAWRDELDVQQIHVTGRGNPAQTRFGLNELRELGSLAAFRPVVQAADFEGAQGSNTAVLPVLQSFCDQEPDARRPIHFHFGCQPQAFASGALSFARGAQTLTLPVDLAVAAIGQRSAPVPGLPYDEAGASIPARDGLVDGREKTFVVGWAANPAGGSIPASRQAAAALLPRLLAALGRTGNADATHTGLG